MEKRYRGPDGRLSVALKELAELTRAEADAYYQDGGRYTYQGREYTLHRLQTGLVQLLAEDGHEVGVTACNLGTFLPDIASEGSEIMRVEEGGDSHVCGRGS